MKKKIKQIKVGAAINQEVTLPIIEIGSGKPVVGIVGGTHGNEPESLFIIRELLAKLGKFTGTLKILPGANPIALIQNKRAGDFDFGDLNRSFPGNAKGTITQRLAAAIFREFSDCELVIDIHSVTNWGAYMGMELGGGTKELLEKTRRVNRLLNPPVIWKAVEGDKYKSAMDEAFLANGICGMGLEVPRLEFIDEPLMEKIVNGLLRVIENPKRVPKLKKCIPILANAKRYFSDFGGIYTPIMKPMSPIKKGDVVGIVTDLITMDDVEIKSEWNGVLFVQSTRKVLKTGDKVFVVTERIGEFR